MYIKLIRVLEGEKGVSNRRGGSEEVVPNEYRMFDVKEVCYRKMKVDSADEFPNGTFLFPVDKYPIECFLIEVKEQNFGGDPTRYEIFIAPNCMMFIMNNEGKTIDSIACRQ